MRSGICRLPVRQPPSKRCVTLDYSRRLRMDGRNPNPEQYTVAILWRGDAAARRVATPQNNRFYRIFEELEALGVRAEPTVYAEEMRRRGAGATIVGGRGTRVGRSDPPRQDPIRARFFVARGRRSRTL